MVILSTSLKLKNGFLDALLKEVDLRKDYLENANVETVYFGGGTPSLMQPATTAAILDHIAKLLLLRADLVSQREQRAAKHVPVLP